ncbi:histidine-type phosphatase [Oxalobacteraceae bacterium A2-2]
MKRPSLPAALLLALLAAASAHADDGYYQTKTPYVPQQDAASYEAPPAGYRAVHTQLLARHGSRGLSSMKSDLALYRLWQQAEKDHALTALGRELGPDLEAFLRANALLGDGVAGITRPGYGNETMQGIAEHTQLAQRLRLRLPELFRDAATASAARREIVVVTSGKDRAVDSGYFFVQSLTASQTGPKPLVVYPPSLAPRAETDHASRPQGTDRYLLYFHKLGKQDQVSDSTDPLFRTWQDSLAYQAYARGDALHAVEQRVLADPGLAAAARAALAPLFTPAFLAALDQGKVQAANSGKVRHHSAGQGNQAQAGSARQGQEQGREVELSGDGSAVIASVTDAGLALYEVYSAAASMRAELQPDFKRYMPPASAAVFAQAEDALAFYEKGPGALEDQGVTSRMARRLLDDFFAEADAVAAGDLRHLAKLRFAHAETVIPFITLLGLPGMSEALPRALPYSYAGSPWRGAAVAPMAANVQWDLYSDGKGGLLLRMLHNEKEVDFKPACDSARVAPSSHYYDYARLKACYGR